MPDYLSRSHRFFLSQFGKVHMLEAARNAAQMLNPYNDLPVNIQRLLDDRTIRVRLASDYGGHCAEGLLVPIHNSFEIVLRPGVAPQRARFSLAHELAHTLFYSAGPAGLVHRIGVMNAAELNAEERICNLVASIMLVPDSAIKSNFPDTDNPAQVLCWIERIARECSVSIQVVLRRLAMLDWGLPRFLAILFTERVNHFTGSDIRLRTAEWVASRWPLRIHIPRNRTLEGLNFASAAELSKSCDKLDSIASGRYFFVSFGKVECSPTRAPDFMPTEEVNLSIRRGNLWQSSRETLLTTAVLYIKNTSEVRHKNLLVVASQL